MVASAQRGGGRGETRQGRDVMWRYIGKRTIDERWSEWLKKPAHGIKFSVPKTEFSLLDSIEVSMSSMEACCAEKTSDLQALNASATHWELVDGTFSVSILSICSDQTSNSFRMIFHTILIVSDISDCCIKAKVKASICDFFTWLACRTAATILLKHCNDTYCVNCLGIVRMWSYKHFQSWDFILL